MCDIKPTICMISYEFHVTSHPVFMTSQDCIHDITPTQLLTSYPLYITWHKLYLWYHSHCNYDKTPTMFLTLYSVYMTSHTLNEWQHNDCIWQNTQCICVIKPTWLMTSHPMYIWNHTHCMYDTIGTLYDLTCTLADNTPLFKKKKKAWTFFMLSFILPEYIQKLTELIFINISNFSFGARMTILLFHQH